MLVKICGIKTGAAARAAVESGTDFIGFVFAESKRKIASAEAAKIARQLPDSVKKVGVFVNEKVDTMKEIAENVGLDMIQLHGDESAEIAEALPYEIIKAIPATREAIERIASYPCNYFLIDTPSMKSRGGSGQAFDWTLLEGHQLDKSKLILAGGLTAGNVRTAIEKVHPAAVDVSSGVETDGVKDIGKIRQFLKQAKQLKEESLK